MTPAEIEFDDYTADKVPRHMGIDAAQAFHMQFNERGIFEDAVNQQSGAGGGNILDADLISGAVFAL